MNVKSFGIPTSDTGRVWTIRSSPDTDLPHTTAAPNPPPQLPNQTRTPPPDQLPYHANVPKRLVTVAAARRCRNQRQTQKACLICAREPCPPSSVSVSRVERAGEPKSRPGRIKTAAVPIRHPSGEELLPRVMQVSAVISRVDNCASLDE
ncbi:hypothetical protein BDY21DRAFT_102401 [Lineolata rhizophorae]|uniref:Uncharacterized protein n=1 Tax=Lineolata rhizophorae TaxID=578093 RepID=A0A6A6NTK2_9PEZI|nr:hypothetical protein BDY21DRAFT_102401 [Lineolata rhizophorae]